MNKVFAIAYKEFLHIIRDPFSMMVVLFLPVMMVFILGHAMEFNIKNIPLSYVDEDMTSSSRMYLDTLASSDYFKLRRVDSPDQGIKDIESDKAKIFLFIPRDFEKYVTSNRPVDLQVLVDGTDNSFSGPAISYLKKISNLVELKITNREVKNNGIKTKYLFNPELNSKWFTIPGIMVVVMAILCSILTTLTIAGEWESGSMEILLSTPIRPHQIVIGKLLPYALMCLAAVVIISGLSLFWFHIPFIGSFIGFVIGLILFIWCYLSLGILLSVVIHKQVTAMQAGIFAGMVPSLLLSGFVFPIENMPLIFQWLTTIFPARWFMDITRKAFLTNNSLIDMSFDFIPMIIFAVIMGCLTVKKFKPRLD